MMTHSKEIGMRVLREDTPRDILIQDIKWLLRQNKVLKAFLISYQRGDHRLPLFRKPTLWERIKEFFSPKED